MGDIHRIEVRGMTCGHCEESVTRALAALDGVTVESVNRDEATAVFRAPGGFDPATAVAAVNAIGFDAIA